MSISTKISGVRCPTMKKRRKVGSIMKKMLFVLVALLIAAPAMADVNLSLTEVSNDGNEAVIAISYTTTAGEAIRAVAIDLSSDGDANIVDVNCVSDDFTIYPGSINIAGSGEVSDDGSCLCDDSYAGTLGGLDTNGVTLEMGSLYVGAANAPADSGVLAEITVAGYDAVDVCVTLNAIRGGVVLEDPDAAVTVGLDCTTVTLNPVPVTDCVKSSAPFYADWQAWGEPDCWCYAKQCRGDLNGSSFIGKPVSLADLNLFKLAFNLGDVDLAAVANGICADLNHASFIGKRVSLADLNTFKLYFNLAEASVPECDNTNYNFWVTP